MFVVQSLPRSGTHLLRTALNGHGSLWCYHEVFNPDMRSHRGADMPPAGIRSVAEVIAHCRSQARLTGFVAHAFTGLADEEQGPGLDAAFRSRRDVHAGRGLWQAIPTTTPFITLTRENLLARYVSSLVAHRRSRWCVRTGERLPAPMDVTIERDSLLVDFARTESLTEIARRRSPQALGVCYEELCTDPNGVFARVQEFLGVEPRRLTPGTVKVGRPLEQSIRNFDEVRHWLTGTRYAAFLEMP